MIITIARQCGCDALQIGQILSERYGVPLYTRQTLRDKAESKGMLDQMAEFFEEKPVDELLLAVTDYSYERKAVNEKFRKAFAQIIGEKDCIIIGRCGNSIFSSRPDLISVFLHGELEGRIRHIMEKEHMGHSAAESFVRYTDDCRVTYHRFYTGLNWGYAPDYDLSIDSVRLGAEKSARIIGEYASIVGVR